ncbi:glycosyltransferase family 2 protein [Georgenia alba]|uniref:Glycosyltransferase family 2 protein n=1 Tax=Georgenia alba TaxID=2233858 RepID=A0ABW2QAP0_9MICO
MHAPTVSIVIPIHNGERFLRATLSSVLAQSGVDFEVVAVNNASTDATAAVLAEWDDPRLRVLTTTTLLPLAQNWRFAMSHARGDLVKVVCADDLIYPGMLATQAAMLTEHPALAVVACRRDFIDEHGRTLQAARGLYGLTGWRTGAEVVRQVVTLGINPIGESAGVMFRRDDYETVGGFDTRRTFPMDIDLWLRLLERGHLYGQAESRAAFRLSTAGLSAAHSRHQHAENTAFATEAAAHWNVSSVQRGLGRVLQPLAWWAWALRARLFGAVTGLRRSHREPAAIPSPPSLRTEPTAESAPR